MSDSPRDCVVEFASALDAEDCARVTACLADDCEYASPEGPLTGPEAIVDSYRGHGDAGRERFDRLVYSHEVSDHGEGRFVITFRDELHLDDRVHVFQCRQSIRVEAGRIASIVHEEIPGERDRLAAFLDA